MVALSRSTAPSPADPGPVSAVCGPRRGREGDRSGDFDALCGHPGVEVLAFEAVAVALEREDLAVVDESVDHRGGGHVVAEDLAPGAEGLVGGDDHRGAFVAAGD